MTTQEEMDFVESEYEIRKQEAIDEFHQREKRKQKRAGEMANKLVKTFMKAEGCVAMDKRIAIDCAISAVKERLKNDAELKKENLADSSIEIESTREFWMLVVWILQAK